ncbi:hypothetical protein P175DRAFT_0141579 [Aspergillus ochraceoroseus IBT 24754]|uniref:Uncharacterized protein n=1 Tax=Aspergillus ochraceoroseus IBT 24754 TaxID=1392256 RepID=A0A2T5M2E0_9EURO|nr:uncharacterized protein P175DRAFT_0141579 [Aspergillus ochraceoroseus IBT 24754]PTU22686.1 hypothetical protein P175DRAFT_0141579 [Aspergillus ochraceoroseus IBT 24754]
MPPSDDRGLSTSSLYFCNIFFSPQSSITRHQFELNDLGWITGKHVEEHWSACLQTLIGHDDWVNSVVFSHNSKLLASTSDNKTIKITMECQQRRLPADPRGSRRLSHKT